MKYFQTSSTFNLELTIFHRVGSSKKILRVPSLSEGSEAQRTAASRSQSDKRGTQSPEQR